MKSRTIPNKRRKNKKREQLLYYTLIASVIIYYIGNTFFSRYTLNSPSYLHICFVMAAILVGIYKAVVNNQSKTKGIGRFILPWFEYTFVFYVLIAGLGFLTFGLINEYYSKENPVERYRLEVIKFYEGSRRIPNRVFFNFHGERTEFSLVSGNDIRKLMSRRDEEYSGSILLECRKGLFGSYIVTDWRIVVEE